MGLTGTLHRISAIRDRDGSVVGLTYRIGRHVAGTPACTSLVVSCTDALTDINGLQHACHYASSADISGADTLETSFAQDAIAFANSVLQPVFAASPGTVIAMQVLAICYGTYWQP